MDLKHIQDLVKMVNKSNISELTIEEKEFKITIKQKEDKYVTAAPVQLAQPAMMAPAAAPQQAFAPASAAPASEVKSTNNLLTIKSPMIGTFYRKAAPGNPNLVQEGDEVRSGTPVCIIEAMKLFNEIESEISGRIVKVLVEDSMPVEYDQPLFLVEPA